MDSRAPPPLLRALRDAIGADHVLVADAQLQAHGRDWRGLVERPPLVVLRPADTAQVATVVALLATAGIPIVPQGGNTGLCAGAVPHRPGQEAVLSLARMRNIEAVDRAGRALTAQAGATLAEVQQAARDAGLYFPLSLAAEGSCQIGGNIATNAGGIAVLRYGSMRSLVLGLEVVLADGLVLDMLGGLRKDNTGVDLKQLFIGSEGTLGIVTRARLALHAAAEQRLTLMAAADDLHAAMHLLDAMSARFGARLSAFELIDEASMHAVLAHLPGARSPFEATHRWYCLVELADSLPLDEAVASVESLLAPMFDEGRVGDVVIAHSAAQSRALWALREGISESLRGPGALVKCDVALPVGRIAEFVDCLYRDLPPRFPSARPHIFGHAGDGNLHLNFVLAGAPSDGETAALAHAVYDLVARHRGSFSAEHGIGQLKLDEMRRYKSSAELVLMAGIKRLLDPHGLLNPGKLLPLAATDRPHRLMESA